MPARSGSLFVVGKCSHTTVACRSCAHRLTDATLTVSVLAPGVAVFERLGPDRTVAQAPTESAHTATRTALNMATSAIGSEFPLLHCRRARKHKGCRNRRYSAPAGSCSRLKD